MWCDYFYIEKKVRSVNLFVDGVWKLLDGVLVLFLLMLLIVMIWKVYFICGDNVICIYFFWGLDLLEMIFYVVGVNCVVCLIIIFFIGLLFVFLRIYVMLMCLFLVCFWLMVIFVGGLGGF